jgi:dsRNA-specific ribonuclease
MIVEARDQGHNAKQFINKVIMQYMHTDAQQHQIHQYSKLKTITKARTRREPYYTWIIK